MEYILFIVISMSMNNTSGGASVATAQISFETEDLCDAASKKLNKQTIELPYLTSVKLRDEKATTVINSYCLKNK